MRLVSLHIIEDYNFEFEVEWCIQSIQSKLR